ncbi:MAG: di-heme oxidoredictase family protein [Planctomycetota bacterium]
MTFRASSAALPVLMSLFLAGVVSAQVGHDPNLGNRITQADVTGGGMNVHQIRREGRRIFTTPFNKLDGYGVNYDVNNPDHTSFPNRPSLQNNGTFLRVNGLDAQTCQECHGVVSNSSIPAELGIGGVAGIANSALFMATEIDVDDSDNNGFANYNGRLINPPFLFGAGGIEALGKEMTTDLLAAKAQAFANPGTVVSLLTHSVSFGHISYDGTDFDYSGVEGVDEDLVVRPFGRKGENHTTRDFDRGAMQFHFGMEPEEVVGSGVDGDNDGVTDELMIGEMSVLHVFANMQPKPQFKPKWGAAQGLQIFASIGCAECHKPVLTTDSNTHTFSFPDDPTDPSANVYMSVNLKSNPMRFQNVPGAGVAVNCFADLKRHDMGPGLTESFGSPLDAEFTTMRLWGVADTAPYLHDGRALTISDAILAHGGEAQTARDNFANLPDSQKLKVLALLRSLRTPKNPSEDLGPADKDVNN